MNHPPLSTDELIPLAEALLLRPDEVPSTPFAAVLAGASVEVTCVLERTAVYHHGDGDRQLVPKEHLSVHLPVLRWHPAPDGVRRKKAQVGREEARRNRLHAKVA
jgi:hypothetical protein